MDKLDRSIIDMMRTDRKFDGNLVNVLGVHQSVSALVRVHNPLHLGMLERNFKVTAMYPFIRSVGIKCELKDAIKLERMQEVEYVSAQGKVFALDNDFDGLDSRNIANSLSLSTDLDGDGVTMCVMDTGVSPHSDLSIPRERIVHFVDMIGSDSEPYDDNGHGTFVAGVACGNGTLSGGRIMGVAPRANIVGLKVIGASGESGTFKILDGMQWLFDNFRQYGIRVVCMSFGAEPQSYADPLKIGAEMLSRSGLTVVVASGNSGENALKSPAISNEVIAVGAVDGNDKLAPFTSRGVYQGALRPDVFADGVEIKGISAGGTYSTMTGVEIKGRSAGGTYSIMTGTSAAAPYGAGACCLLCQKYRNITPRQIKHAIINSANTVDGNKIFKL